jgi:transposase-like protein
LNNRQLSTYDSGKNCLKDRDHRCIRRNQLYKWRDELQNKGDEAAFPDHGRRRGADAELARLKRENERFQEENAILKKAARYFARESS